MAKPFDTYKITEQTQLKFVEREITLKEYQWLQGSHVLDIEQHANNTGEVIQMEIDFSELADLAFEHSLLKGIASNIELEILKEFEAHNDNRLTTQELAQFTNRPKASVSRALSRLVEKNKLVKVQDGLYRYNK